MSSGCIGIFVATMTGLAEICAEEVTNALSSAGIASETRLMDTLNADALNDFDTIVIVSSTYGHGDIPDNGQAFYEAILAGGSLQGKSFTVFALGDRTYSDTFCHAGNKWDALFSAKGANRIAPLERHDASSGTLAEDEAGAWAAGWAPSLRMAA
ncbi:MAG: flavodoxin domain-containing protein [Pseudomonadota bacterium]